VELVRETFGPGKDVHVADPTDEATQPDAGNPSGEAAATSKPDKEKDSLSTDDIENLLDQAADSLEQAAGDHVSTEAAAKPYNLNNLSPDANHPDRQPIDLVGEVEMDLRIELGRTQMRLEEVLELRGGSVVALDKLAGDPVDVFVNGRLIARGEVLVMNDNFCIRVTELVGA
jgi:flagellar motor switch protein FliN/FliY